MYEFVNTGGAIEVGTYTINESGEMSADWLVLKFHRTDLFATEQVRLRVERSNAPSTPFYSSWVTPKNVIDGFTDTNHWIGRVRFDYDKQQMTGGTTVKIFLETQNYTYADGGTQIGAIAKYLDSSGEFDVIVNTAAYKAQFLYR